MRSITKDSNLDIRQTWKEHKKRTRAGRRILADRLNIPTVVTLNSVQGSCNMFLKSLNNKLPAYTKRTVLRAKMTTEQILKAGRLNSANPIFNTEQALEASLEPLVSPSLHGFPTMEAYKVHLVKELEGLLQYQCQGRHNVDGGRLLTSEPEPASLVVLLDPSYEHKDHVIGIGPSMNQNTADTFHGLMKAAFVDARRNGGKRAASHKEPKYFINGRPTETPQDTVVTENLEATEEAQAASACDSDPDSEVEDSDSDKDSDSDRDSSTDESD
jgi:hypothetical protein